MRLFKKERKREREREREREKAPTLRPLGKYLRTRLSAKTQGGFFWCSSERQRKMQHTVGKREAAFSSFILWEREKNVVLIAKTDFACHRGLKNAYIGERIFRD